MRLLLDTHIALWAITDDERLTESARTLISDDRNEKVVSAVAIWEIAIKHALGKGRRDAMPIGGGEALRYFGEAGYRILPVSAQHAAALDDLPPHHGDPFDRMLIAQARVEPLRLVTSDGRLSAYGDAVLVV